VLGLGELPTVRLQRALARVGDEGAEWRALDACSFGRTGAVPRAARSLLYILARRPERFTRAACDDVCRVQRRRELLLG